MKRSVRSMTCMPRCATAKSAIASRSSDPEGDVVERARAPSSANVTGTFVSRGNAFFEAGAGYSSGGFWTLCSVAYASVSWFDDVPCRSL